MNHAFSAVTSPGHGFGDCSSSLLFLRAGTCSQHVCLVCSRHAPGLLPTRPRLFSTRTTPIPNTHVPNTPQLQPTRLTFKPQGLFCRQVGNHFLRQKSSGHRIFLSSATNPYPGELQLGLLDPGHSTQDPKLKSLQTSFLGPPAPSCLELLHLLTGCCACKMKLWFRVSSRLGGKRRDRGCKEEVSFKMITTPKSHAPEPQN